MNLPQTDSGGGTDFAAKAVHMDPKNVHDLAKALRADAVSFRDRTREVAAYFGGGESAGQGERPWGADPRNQAAHPIVEFHDESMEVGLKTLTDYALAMDRLASMAEQVARTFVNQDELNAASEDDVANLLGLINADL